MFYSRKYDLLFIACPKTGSTSVELYLLKLDPDGEKFSFTMPNKKITHKDMGGVVGHAKAQAIKEAIGEKEYNALKVFGFVRDPLEKLISSYNFNKQSRFSQVFYKNEKVIVDKNTVKQFFTIAFSKVLPFKLWALIYPMKTCYEYFHDRNNNRIVSFLGRTDQLDRDMKIILRNFGLLTNSSIPHVNKSKKKPKEDYLKHGGLIRSILEKRYEKDIKLYEAVENEMHRLENSLNETE